jgi:hypothetical protein
MFYWIENNTYPNESTTTHHQWINSNTVFTHSFPSTQKRVNNNHSIIIQEGLQDT